MSACILARFIYCCFYFKLKDCFIAILGIQKNEAETNFPPLLPGPPPSDLLLYLLPIKCIAMIHLL